MSADYWALMPDPCGGEPDPKVDKCNLCRRTSHVHSVGSVPNRGAFGPQTWLCGPCLSVPVVTCPACGEQYRIPSTEPVQSGSMCYRCRCDIADHYDNQFEE